MEGVTDEPLYRDRVCGIDPARRAAETRSFGTTKREVLALADWLRCWQVPAVVMEATSVICGQEDQTLRSHRSRHCVRVCDGTDKSGTDER